MPLEMERARLREELAPVPLDVLRVEQRERIVREESGEQRLPLEQRPLAQVLPVEIEQVEGDNTGRRRR